MYSDSVITLIDVLGFSALVGNVDNEEKIARILQSLKHSTVPTKIFDDQFDLGIRATQFSDTVVRTCGTQNKFNYGILFHELSNLAMLQMSLISEEEVFVRGAITLGQVIHREDQIFGPGIVQAHKLESELAIYPRIVIDPSVLIDYRTNDRLKSQNHTFEMDLSYTKNYMRRDSDGIWFIDYLKAIEGELESLMEYRDILKKHRDAVVKTASNFKRMDKISAKYAWLSSYHNSVAGAYFSNHKIHPDKSLLIKSAEIPSLDPGFEI